MLILDLIGVAVFAVSGAVAAARARLDVFGIVVLGVITALGGGVIRDLLLGITPPSTLRQWPYLLVAGLASLLAWIPPAKGRSRAVTRRTVLVADALGLSLFVTTGTATAFAVGAPAVTACLVGVLTGVGGGVLRDVLLREIPMVLHRDIYALPAIAGAHLVAAGHWLSWPEPVTLAAGAVSIATLRLLAIWRGWDAPRPPERTQPDELTGH